MTKIAFGAKSHDELESWFRARESLRLTTRYLPRRHEEMVGGSLYWILNHQIVARSPITGFARAKDGRWHIDLEARLIRVHPVPRRAHQGWRYLREEDAPRDLAEGETPDGAMPGDLASRLERLGLI